jgi:hypothetical protein
MADDVVGDEFLEILQKEFKKSIGWIHERMCEP